MKKEAVGCGNSCNCPGLNNRHLLPLYNLNIDLTDGVFNRGELGELEDQIIQTLRWTIYDEGQRENRAKEMTKEIAKRYSKKGYSK
jgi:hypothetical protein